MRMLMLITPTPVDSCADGNYCEVTCWAEDFLKKEFEAGNLSDLEFVDHFDFDFYEWDVSVSEGKRPALLLEIQNPIVPKVLVKTVKLWDLGND